MDNFTTLEAWREEQERTAADNYRKAMLERSDETASGIICLLWITVIPFIIVLVLAS